MRDAARGAPLSTTKVSAIHDVAGHDNYVHEGRGAQRRKHLAGGSDRLAPGWRSDLPREEFVTLGQQLARGHGRRVEALGFVVAWSPDELSIDNVADLQIAGDHAYELAKRLHPHSPVSVVTHADSSGGHVHCHVAILNHNFETGRALAAGCRHCDVAAVNDVLSRERGMRVLEPQPRIAQPAARPFDDLLRARLEDALACPGTHDWTSFVSAAAARGVEVVTAAYGIRSDACQGKRCGGTSVGVTYRAMDTIGPKERMRRRKASVLGPGFTYDEIVSHLAERAGRQQESHDQRCEPDRAMAPNRAQPVRAQPTRGRSELVRAMRGLALRGAYSSLAGWESLALQIGIQAARARQRPGLEYGYADEPRRWHESELPPELSEAAVLDRIAGYAVALREIEALKRTRAGRAVVAACPCLASHPPRSAPLRSTLPSLPMPTAASAPDHPSDHNHQRKRQI
uniref:relaxase/mobilization nuclease domain-containing protein n=1 Tax=Microbacterium aquilitoris TaxID=3067307 RepID=UPI0035E31D8C